MRRDQCHVGLWGVRVWRYVDIVSTSMGWQLKEWFECCWLKRQQGKGQQVRGELWHGEGLQELEQQQGQHGRHQEQRLQQRC